MKLTEEQKQHRKARRLWVKALRSGEFGWGKSYLEPTKGNFCCLGVACMVAEKQGIELNRNDNGSLYGASLNDQIPVMNWLGLKFPGGKYGDGNPHLALVNDDADECPFAQIADIIESEPEGLFVD